MRIQYNGNDFSIFEEDYVKNWTITLNNDIEIDLTLSYIGLFDECGMEQSPMYAIINLCSNLIDLTKFIDEDILLLCDETCRDEECVQEEEIYLQVSSCEQDTQEVMSRLLRNIMR